MNLIIRDIVLTAIILSFSCGSLRAAVKEIDRRNASERDAYFIVFCARGGSATGHAFVTQGIHDSKAKQCRANAFGFYPREGKGVLGPVPGKVVDEAFSSPTTERLIVRVNKNAYESAAAIRQKWENRDYRVLEQDCITFISEVAKELRLKLPPRSSAFLPQDFMKKMIIAND